MTVYWTILQEPFPFKVAAFRGGNQITNLLNWDFVMFDETSNCKNNKTSGFLSLKEKDKYSRSPDNCWCSSRRVHSQPQPVTLFRGGLQCFIFPFHSKWNVTVDFIYTSFLCTIYIHLEQRPLLIYLFNCRREYTGTFV